MIGTALGLPLAFGASRALAGFLQVVDANEAALVTRVAAQLFAVVVLATAIPAWHATRVAPEVALRAE